MLTESKVRIQGSGKDEYFLSLENGKAVKCSCPDCFYRRHVCKHQHRFNSCEVVNSFVKPSGIMCARVQEGDASYFVTLYPNGNGECCSCCVGASGCVHTCKVQAMCDAIHPVSEMDEDADVVCSLAEVMADADTAMRQAEHENPYEILAGTKDIVNNKALVGEQWQAYRYYEMGLGVNY